MEPQVPRASKALEGSDETEKLSSRRVSHRAGLSLFCLLGTQFALVGLHAAVCREGRLRAHLMAGPC
jgi:hypothetical protein